MKAIRIHEFGASKVLSYNTEPRPFVGDQEVLIKIEAAGVGRVDVSADKGIMLHYLSLDLFLELKWLGK